MSATVLIVLVLVVAVAVGAYLAWSRSQLPRPEDHEGLPGSEKKPEAPAKLPEPAKVPPATTAEAVKADAPRVEPARPLAPPVAASVAEKPKTEPARAEAAAAPAPEVARTEARTEPATRGAGEGAAVATAPVREAPAERPRRDLSALKKGLAQTRTGWMQRLRAVFGGKKEIDPALLDAIEETLLTGDVGSKTSRRFVDGLRARLDRHELADEDRVWDALKADSVTVLEVAAPAFGSATGAKPLVILMVGVNGAGKTTTIAKLASRYKDLGKTVLLAAGDTFRAAAVMQLEMWGRRVGVPVYKGKDAARPSAVIYEAVAQGVAQGTDVVIADTAGRLQTKAPLMEELRKIRDACGKACPGAPHEILLVLDATTGQNAVSQAREFRDTLDLTGVVLTKLDGTAKGGVILAIADEFKLPVRFIGVGEKSEDLREFDARDFVEALFTRAGDDAAA